MRILVLFIIFVFLMVYICVQAEEFPKKAQKIINEAISVRQDIQKERERWHKEYLKLVNEYRKLQEEVEILEEENKKLKQSISQKLGNIDKYQDEIKKLSEISKDMLPFLMEVYKNLERFINSDVPFLKEEREKRLLNLKRILADPGISLGEKFRKTMEALFVEAEYGNTIEVYKDKAIIGGKTIEGDIFRLGRIALFFQSPDKKITAIYDPSISGWRILPGKYKNVINTAIDIAERRRPVELLSLPLGRLKNKP